MPTDVIMPQMGESIFEGTITKWLKKAGDPVEKDEPLFEISTDKVDAEIPSPVAGVLSEIKVPEGATVEVNTVVAVVSESGEAVAAPAPAPSAAPKAPRAQDAAPAPPQAQPAPAAAPVSGITEVVMPQMGESIFEGTITKWLKQAGDRVEKDEPLFEISTDKVDAEIPAPVAGVLAEIKVEAGVTVQVNTVVAVISGTGVPIGDIGASSPTQSGTAQNEEARAPLKAAGPSPQIDAANAAGALASEGRSSKASQVPSQASAASSTRPLRSSPLVRRIARENNLDLALIAGTGSEGRITKDDVLSFLAGNSPSQTPAAPQAPAKPQSAPPQGSRVVPMTRMRAIIAERMLESKRISPHVHTVYKVDMTRIARLRERERARFEQAHGVKLTYMPFIAAATVHALGMFPVVNASLEGSSIRYHEHINLGIAVSLEWGLIVPVVKQAGTLSFLALARSIADLAARARTKKLLPEEVQGSTFTLTNSGVFGGEFGTPIINQPESAILAIGGLRKEPVVLTDDEGNDSIAIRSVQYFCLGFDHRTIDGADSGKFMAEFKKTLEAWDREIA